MTFQAGQSGNPGGRSKDRPWRDALALVAREIADPKDPLKRTKLRVVAEKIFEKAMEGDSTAAREIGDRLDGKAIQQLTGDGEDGALLVKILRYAAEEAK